MAAERKGQTKKLKFEVTWSAVAGIAVIVFCLFLWMFLLGVWAGQSLLSPVYGKKETAVADKGQGQRPSVTKADKKAILIPQHTAD
jgi:hypothetical protein